MTDTRKNKHAPTRRASPLFTAHTAHCHAHPFAGALLSLGTSPSLCIQTPPSPQGQLFTYNITSFLSLTHEFFSIIFIEHLLYIKHGTMPETQQWNQNFTFKQLRIYEEEQGSDYNNVHAIRETTKYSGDARKRNTQVSFECPTETRKEPLLGLGPGAEKGRNCWSKRKRNNSE